MKIKKKILYTIIALIFASLSGLIALQMYFIKNAYSQKEQAFKSNVVAALNNVAIVLESNEAARNLYLTAAADSMMSPQHKSGRNKRVVSLSLNNPSVHKKSISGSVVQRNYGKSQPFKIFISVKDSAGKQIITKQETGNSQQGNQAHRSYFYKYSTDSNIFIVNSQRSRALKELSKTNKKKIVTRVVDNLMLAELVPIEKRVRKKEIDSLLKAAFREAGINLEYSFGILSGEKDSLKISNGTGTPEELRNSQLKARLFPSDFNSPRNFLAVYFPGSGVKILKDISPLLLLSLLFILIIGISFIYTIRTIINQKRFASLLVDFINNMTHEFKTPISTISLASEAISNPAVSADYSKLSRYNNVIKEENSRMRTQVEKILQMAVIEEGDYELDLQILDLHGLIRKAIENYSLQIEKKGGQISSNLSAENCEIYGDLVHISNIVHNLLDNAVKYSVALPEIKIETENMEGKILVRISDKGTGISEEHIKKVFDKYYRVPTGNTHDIKGFGLGLSYVKLMTEAHMGNITIKSKPGRGTIVIWELPLRIQKEN